MSYGFDQDGDRFEFTANDAVADADSLSEVATNLEGYGLDYVDGVDAGTVRGILSHLDKHASNGRPPHDQEVKQLLWKLPNRTGFQAQVRKLYAQEANKNY